MNNLKYKTIPDDKTSHGHKWILNKWCSIKGKLKMCENGFHCSDNFIDAFQYVSPGWICLVEVEGEAEKKEDKSVHEKMRIVKWKKWTKKDSVSLAIFAAELVLNNYEKEYPDDKRPRDAIEAASQGDERAKLAIEMESYRLKKYIGAYAAALGRVDALVFTAGVGELSDVIRTKVLVGLDILGIKYDPK